MPSIRTLTTSLGFKRFRRSKSSTLTVYFAILIALTFILSTAIGTKYIKSSIIIRDLDDVSTDVSIGVSLPDYNYNPSFYNLSLDLKTLPYINKTIIKYHIRGEEWRDENLTHNLWVNNSINNNFHYSPYHHQLDILSYRSENLEEYVNLMDIELEKDNDSLLKTNETIISHYLAQELKVSINDTIYLNYINRPQRWGSNQSFFNKSYPLIVKNIMIIPSKSNLAKDLLKNPFISNYDGTINELIILEPKTFLSTLDYLTGDYGDEFSSQLVISIFLKREKIIADYNLKKSSLLLDSIEKETINKLRAALPKGTVFFSENLLFKALELRETDIRELQRTLSSVSIPIVFLVFVITLYLRTITINSQISDYGVLICRGLNTNVIRRSFLVEGGVIGVLAAFSSSLTCLGLTSILYFIIPNDKDFYNWVSIFAIDLPSLMVNALFLGLLIGLGVNYFASRKIMELNPIDAVYIYRGGLTSWYEKHQTKIRLIIIFLTFIMTLEIILRIISLTGILGMFSEILYLIEDVISDLLLLVPILLILLLVIIVTNRRDIFTKYMVSFSFFLNENLKSIIRFNYLRRPKNFSKLAIITAIAFAMGITPIMLSQSAQDVSIRQIKREIGSDIKITSTYEQMKDITPSTLYNLSSNIIAVTPMIWVESLIIVANYSNYKGHLSYIEFHSAGILAIQPENFVESLYFENCFTPDNEPDALFSQLNSDAATAVAQIEFTNYQIDQDEYIQHDIGSVLPVQIVLTEDEKLYLNFTVVGFYYLIPGFTKENFHSPSQSLICSIDFLESEITIPPDSQMTWLIKINPKANKTIRTEIHQNIDDQFKEFEVFFVDNTLESFLFTQEGSIVIIMDSMFFIVLALSLFGLNLTFFQTFNERRTEVAIYRARGMNLRDLFNIFFNETLSVNTFGAIFGVLLGLVTTLIYKDVLITPWPKIPVYLFFPWPKIILFIVILTLTNLICIFGQSYWRAKSRIIENLRIRD
ncbi:MAG: ABC transporter permease [Candidatus Hodarchaeota archaeon]